MISIKKLLIIIISFGYSLFVQGQSDSTVLAFSMYLEHIMLHHPIAKKANLKTKLGSAKWLSAKGNLDPKLIGSWSEKDFDEKLYYRKYGGQIKVPTKWGLDVVGGYENTEGVFLNPEDKTDDYGLWNLGVELNVLQGLFVNERSIALQQAKVFQQITENERQIIFNKLLYDAAKAYLDWQKYFYFRAVFNENIDLASNYFINTKSSFESGEKTAMDTLEAYILFQDANVYLNKNEVAFEAARQNIENYLWMEDAPLSLKMSVKPEPYNSQLLQINEEEEIANLLFNHPVIRSYQNKKSYFEIEQRLKKEKLKPKLKLKYSPLLSTTETAITPNLNLSNYKWGVDFSMPLLFRSEKAEVQRGEIKIQETILDIENKENELVNKIENSQQQLIILRQQLDLSQQNLEGYRLLMEGENEKFRYGESSVFLLNKRQEKYIQARLKLIDLYIKLEKERLNYLFYANDLTR